MGAGITVTENRSIRAIVHHPLFIILSSALIVRILLTTVVSHGYDSEYWLMIAQNIESGNHSYGLNGNYYTPVWGYLLSFWDLVIGWTIPSFGYRFTELLPADEYGCLATIATPLANFLVKTPMSICDILTGYAIYRLLKEITSEKRAILGAACWCFCPIIIYMSAIHGQFETVSSLIIILFILAVRHNRIIEAGALFAVGVWLKLFPAVCIFILLAYVAYLYRDNYLKKIIIAAISFAITTLIIFIPQIVNGELEFAFSFLTTRLSDPNSTNTYTIINAIIAFFIVSLGIIRRFSQNPKNADESLLLGFGALMGILIWISPGYQYAPSLMLFLCFAIALKPGYVYPTLYIVCSFGSLLLALIWLQWAGLFIDAAYYGWFDPSWVANQAVNFAKEWGISSVYWVPNRYDYIWINGILITVIILAVDALGLRKYLSDITRIVKK